MGKLHNFIYFKGFSNLLDNVMLNGKITKTVYLKLAHLFSIRSALYILTFVGGDLFWGMGSNFENHDFLKFIKI